VAREPRHPFGWSEVEGIAARGDYDLSAHQRVSGRDLTYFDDLIRERYICPWLTYAWN